MLSCDWLKLGVGTSRARARKLASSLTFSRLECGSSSIITAQGWLELDNSKLEGGSSSTT